MSSGVLMDTTLPGQDLKIQPLAGTSPVPPATDFKPPTMPVVPSGERKEAALPGAEKVGAAEIEPVKEKGPEIKDYVTKLETGEEIQLPQPVLDDSGQPIVSPAAPQQVTVTLPLTEEEMNQALHLKIIYSIRWLAEWMQRAIKIIGRTFIYKFKI